MTLRLFAAAALAALAAATLTAEQQANTAQGPSPAQSDTPPLTFRVEVNYVEVDATVTDAQGNLVTDLTADDFEILEDRRAQTISSFSLVRIPVERAERPLFAAAPIEPDVQTNTGVEGRIYLIVLDSLHTSFENTLRVRAAARQFIERSFGANDLAAVVFTGGQTRDTQDFTGNPRLLLAAIDRFAGMRTPGQTQSLAEQLGAGITRLPGDPVADPAEFQRAYNARSSMDRIRELSTFMGGVRGRRKAMLLVGEGVDYEFADIINNAQATGVLESFRDAIGAATRANVAIYAIDPRGLSNPEASLIGVAGAPGLDDPSAGDLGTRSIGREFQQSQNSLRILANDTGGFAVLNQNDFSTAFDRIVRDNSTYYVLGYYPTNERRDGRFRAITVRVKRPGLQVRSRRGYVAPRGRAPGSPSPAPAAGPGAVTAAVSEAVGSPVPISGIPLTVSAVPFKGVAPNAAVAVAVELRVDDFTFTEANGTFNDRVEIAMLPTDREGKTQGGERVPIGMAMRPETLAAARERGFRLTSQVNVPPGRYQLRVGAAEEGGKAGSVLFDLEVPDFAREPFTMSGVALTSARALTVPTGAARSPLGSLLPAPLSAAREFSRDDELALYVEFYENAPNAPPHRLDLATTVRAEDGRTVFENREERQSTELQGASGGYGYQMRIPLSGLGPGAFVLRVEGRSRLGDQERSVARDIFVRVR